MKPTVLIVDDSEFVRQALAEAMRGEPGLEVLCAENGREALVLLAERSIDALVLDVNMPIVDGTQVLEGIAKAGKGSLYVVAIGDNGQSEMLESCRALGADAVMTKPVDVEALRSMVTVAVSSEIQVTR